MRNPFKDGQVNLNVRNAVTLTRKNLIDILISKISLIGCIHDVSLQTSSIDIFKYLTIVCN